MEHKIKINWLGVLLILLPVLIVKEMGVHSVRTPQFWIWCSGAILLYVFNKENFWLNIFILYCLAVFLYTAYTIIHYPFGFNVLGLPNTFTIKAYLPTNTEKVLYSFKAIAVDYSFVNWLIGLSTLFLSLIIINSVQKMNTIKLKYCIFASCFVVLVFWTILKIENQWISGAYFAFCLPLMISFKKYKYKIIGVLICIVGIVLSKSTTAMLAGTIGGLICVVNKKKYKYFIIPVLIIISLGIFCIKQYSNDIGTFNFRKKVWIQAINKAGFTLTGTGLRSFRRYDITEGKGVLTTHAHNEFVELYCETGVIGLILCFCFIISLFKIKTPKYLKAGLTGIIAHSFFYYPCHIPMTGLIILIYIGMIKKEEGNESKKNNTNAGSTADSGACICTIKE